MEITPEIKVGISRITTSEEGGRPPGPTTLQRLRETVHAAEVAHHAAEVDGAVGGEEAVDFDEISRIRFHFPRQS